MPFLILFVFAIAGLATWFAIKSKEKPASSTADHTQGGTFALFHPTIPKPPKLASGNGETSAPPFIGLALNAPTALDFGSHDPIVPTPGYDVSVSDAVQTRIESFAHAIAKAEGFGIPGALPTRAKNPGDLKLGDQGHGLLNGKTIFGTAQDGWNALFNQIKLIVSGRSRYYTVDDTIEKMAQTWTANNNASSWANTVSAELNVSQSSTIRAYLGV